MGQRGVGHLWHCGGTADTGRVGGGGAGSWGPRVGQGGKVWHGVAKSDLGWEER